MNRKSNMVIGVILVAIGMVFMLNTLNIINFSYSIFNLGFLISRFWPLLFLIIPGIIFHSVYFSGRNNDPGILVPGGILLVTGLTCQVSMLFGLWHVMWPGFILAVAFGLFELYLFGRREKALLIPVTILGVLSAMFFNAFTFRWIFQMQTRKLIIAAILIFIGLMVIYRNLKQNKEF